MKNLCRFVILLTSLLFGLDALAVEPSGTLPVLTINTENSAPVVDKENYLKATYSLDTKGAEGMEAISGELQIKGRGNWTWRGFDKKPYRLKLDKKAALMGMKKSKHFALLAHADDNLGFLREPLGFKLSRLVGLDWTPDMKPVEVILNGDYIGLYFLVETIRVDKDRVNIYDQEEEVPSTDVTGGWICEIDNYDEPDSEQIRFNDPDGRMLRITHKSPEEINEEQRVWLWNQYQDMTKAIYINDPASTEWEKYIDVNSLSKYFIVRELVDDQEAFHGSCYMTHDRGADKKWKFGPVWDFGASWTRDEQKHIYQDPTWGQEWIHRLVKFTNFTNEYTKVFKDFMDNGGYDAAMDYLEEFASQIDAAAKKDAERWQQAHNSNYNHAVNWDVMGSFRDIKAKFTRHARFLADSYGVEVNLPTYTGFYLRGEINDWATPSEYEFVQTGPDTYELSDVTISGKFKIADSTWAIHNWGFPEANKTVDMEAEKPQEVVNHLDYNDMVMPTRSTFKRVVFKITEPDKKGIVTLTNSSVITGVNVEMNPANVIIFDLYGNRVKNIIPGSVYIVNGRKVIGR